MDNFKIQELKNQCNIFFKEFNPVDALNKIECESYTVEHYIIRKKGFCDWTTAIIIFNYNQNFEWYGMLALSCSDDFNKILSFPTYLDKTEISGIISSLEDSKNWFNFFRNDSRVADLENLTVSKALKYDAYLKTIGVDIFAGENN